MNIDSVTRPVTRVSGEWDRRAFETDGEPALTAGYEFRLETDRATAIEPPCTASEASAYTADYDGVSAKITYQVDDRGRFVDECISVHFHETPATLLDVSVGLQLDAAELGGFTATPIPFRIGKDGQSKVIDLSRPGDYTGFAEGWVIDNGRQGFLVMRVPTPSALTCFVPLEIRRRDERWVVRVGSIGPDGDGHQTRSPFLNAPMEGTVEFPTTRFVFFSGDWRTGYEIFRQMVRMNLSRRPFQRPACPISYNTYHDFGPKYDRARLVELMPMLSQMGFGLIHLDPGWEIEWGSNIWGEAHMGPLEDFVTKARRHNLQVGCWTSVHSVDTEVHGEGYALDASGSKYIAEDFGQEKMCGVCPASVWQDLALERLSRLGKAGFVFLNSDFHDWPWENQSCHATNHWHDAPLTRVEWTEHLNQLYERLHRECPNMVIELHDHVESGDYRTPVWYLYDRPDSFDEKWAYEFMWKTFDDLMEGRLFSLYHLRLAEPIPLFLHMNASSDNENALAFWYVASCVNHIGVGAILKSSEAQREAYARAFGHYNERFDAFTRGEFHGIDELTHVHVYPDRSRAVIIAFNLEEHPVERKFVLEPEAWGMTPGELSVNGAESSGGEVTVTIPARGVALVDAATATA